MPVPLVTLLGDLATLEVGEKRRLDEGYVELVGSQSGWDEWSRRLAAALGPAKKPAGQKPTSDQERRADPWGGIRKDQILFEGKWEGAGVVALVWPWVGGERFTLKLARVP